MRNTKLVKKKLKIINEFELQAMDIAKRMLESSFDIEKSIGFLEFKKKQ